MSQSNPTDIQANTYAENYVLYGDQSRAWRMAFPDSKATDKSVNEKASKFHNIIKVQSRITEIQERLSKQSEVEFDISVSELKEMLVKAARRGLKTKIDAQENKVAHNIAGAVSAIAEINRMDGNHYQYKSDEENKGKAQPLNINFTVDNAVKEVKVTNAKN